MHASMPMMHGGNAAITSLSLARGTAGLTNPALPAALTPCTAKTFLARSIPTNKIVTRLPLPDELMRFATPSWHSLPFAALRLVRDGEVPFIS